jgi:hypothetical protein
MMPSSDFSTGMIEGDTLVARCTDSTKSIVFKIERLAGQPPEGTEEAGWMSSAL